MKVSPDSKPPWFDLEHLEAIWANEHPNATNEEYWLAVDEIWSGIVNEPGASG